MIFAWFPFEPRPCPVDDAPHTTCVSPDYVLTEPMLAAGRPQPPLIVKVRSPFVDDRAVLPPVQAQTISEPVTTKTYRRKRVR